MFSKLPTLKLYSLISQRTTSNINIHVLRYFLFHQYSHLCTITDSPQIIESPELPGWVKSSENQKPEVTDADEDFVIPSLAEWVQQPLKLHSRDDVVKHISNPNNESDVDRISDLLKKRYPSLDSVVQSLDGCGFNVSNDLVEQLLKRFSNDWNPAFGFFTWAKNQTGYKHSSDLYNFMVDILGRAKKFDFMFDLVKEMNAIEGYVTMETMTKVMRRLARAGKYKEAIKTFRGMDQFGVTKDTSSLNLLMDALVKGSSVEYAQIVYLEFKDSIAANLHTFNILIHGWCKVRKFEQANLVMEAMRIKGIEPDVVSYTSFIEAYCHEKNFRRAKEVLETMKEKGCNPNVVTYTILMHALGKAGQINEALGVYEKMKENGCVPDSSLYGSLIYILSKAGRLKDAREVFDEMPNQGVAPDLLTYNTVITCACMHSQEEEALKLLKEMEEKGCKPDIKAYSLLLKLCCKKKRMKVMNFLLDHMFQNNVSIDAGTYSLLVGQLSKHENVERACSFFEEMVSKGLSPKRSVYKKLLEELERKSMSKEKQYIEKLMVNAEQKTS